MKRLLKTFSRPVIFTPSLVIIALALVGLVFFMKHRAAAATPHQSVAATPVQSQFSFSGVPGWHKGPTNETSMALFRDDGECFTSIEHKSGAVDVDTEIQKQQSMMASSGNTMAAGATPVVTVQAGTGSQQYELHEFSLSSGDKSHPLMGGLGLGYLQLSNGYIKIQSHCNTADELPSTVPALEAYQFHTN